MPTNLAEQLMMQVVAPIAYGSSAIPAGVVFACLYLDQEVKRRWRVENTDADSSVLETLDTLLFEQLVCEVWEAPLIFVNPLLLVGTSRLPADGCRFSSGIGGHTSHMIDDRERV